MTQLEAKESYPEDPGEAIEKIIELHGSLLYSLGLKFCGNEWEAEDLVQETMINAFKGWESFEGRSKVTTWLYTIASRVCQKLHRKKAGEPLYLEPLQELVPLNAKDFAKTASELDALELADVKKESLEKIERGISQLPLEFRMPLILKDVVGLTGPEISKIMEIEEGTVKSRVHRARLKLRKIVDSLIPRMEIEPPPVQYSVEVCLDLLNAKQSAIDNNVEFTSDIICLRCQSVFDSLDIAHDVCSRIASNEIPAGLLDRIKEKIGRNLDS